eukprot:m.21417 g.21417  ORF g.21417 m.21417 type:complete len:771 (-) comp11139_c0_seq1:245-2557(-)
MSQPPIGGKPTSQPSYSTMPRSMTATSMPATTMPASYGQQAPFQSAKLPHQVQPGQTSFAPSHYTSPSSSAYQTVPQGRAYTTTVPNSYNRAYPTNQTSVSYPQPQRALSSYPRHQVNPTVGIRGKPSAPAMHASTTGKPITGKPMAARTQLQPSAMPRTTIAGKPMTHHIQPRGKPSTGGKPTAYSTSAAGPPALIPSDPTQASQSRVRSGQGAGKQMRPDPSATPTGPTPPTTTMATETPPATTDDDDFSTVTATSRDLSVRTHRPANPRLQQPYPQTTRPSRMQVLQSHPPAPNLPTRQPDGSSAAYRTTTSVPTSLAMADTNPFQLKPTVDFGVARPYTGPRDCRLQIPSGSGYPASDMATPGWAEQSSKHSQLKRWYEYQTKVSEARPDFDKLWAFFGKLEIKAGGLGDAVLLDIQFKLQDLVDGQVTVPQFADYVQRLFGIKDVSAIARKLELWLTQLKNTIVIRPTNTAPGAKRPAVTMAASAGQPQSKRVASTTASPRPTMPMPTSVSSSTMPSSRPTTMSATTANQPAAPTPSVAQSAMISVAARRQMPRRVINKLPALPSLSSALQTDADFFLPPRLAQPHVHQQGVTMLMDPAGQPGAPQVEDEYYTVLSQATKVLVQDMLEQVITVCHSREQDADNSGMAKISDPGASLKIFSTWYKAIEDNVRTSLIKTKEAKAKDAQSGILSSMFKATNKRDKNRAASKASAAASRPRQSNILMTDVLTYLEDQPTARGSLKIAHAQALQLDPNYLQQRRIARKAS